MEYLTTLHLPDVDRLLQGQEEVDFRALREDEVYILFAMIGATLTRYHQEHRERHQRDGQRLFWGISQFVTLCEQVAQANKLDAGFVPIRQVVQKGLFQQALMVGYRTGEHLALAQRLKKVFSAGDVAEYIEVLGLGHGAQRG